MLAVSSSRVEIVDYHIIDSMYILNNQTDKRGRQMIELNRSNCIRCISMMHYFQLQEYF